MRRTPEFVEKCRDLYLGKGLPFSTIARKLGCHPSTVKKALRSGAVDLEKYCEIRHYAAAKRRLNK